VKTAVYSNINGDIVSYTLKTAKSKKVILLSNTLTFGNVVLGNIIQILTGAEVNTEKLCPEVM